MEKAETASSTSRCSEIRWRRSMPAKAHRGAPSHRTSFLFVEVAVAVATALVFSSRQKRGGWVGAGAGGAAGACTQMSTAATTMPECVPHPKQ